MNPSTSASPPGGPRPANFAELLQRQRQRWRNGNEVAVESLAREFAGAELSSEELLDLIYNEILLRREKGIVPQLDDFVGRFPALADQVRLLFEIDGALGEGGLPNALSMVSGGANDTSTAELAQGNGPAASSLAEPNAAIELVPSRVAGPFPQSAVRELEHLLRRRLRFTALILTSFYACDVLLGLLTQPRHLDQFPGTPIGVLLSRFILAGLAVASLALWSARPLALVWLRPLELFLFALPVAQMTWLHADSLWFRHELIRAFRDQPSVSVHMINSIIHHYFPIIVAYGVLIPNTGRRCLAVVTTIALAPLVMVLVGASFEPGIWKEYGGTLARELFVLLVWMAVAVAIAVYGCHRIDTLQREVRAARQLGQYRLLGRLGSGGMGEVHLAQHVLLREPCAVKVIRPERAGDQRDLGRFEREVRAMARLKHPNTVRIFDYGLAANGTFYYVMEYLPGLNLDELVRHHGRLPLARAIYLLLQACGALREAHAMGLIHRDIKPANLIVCERGGVYDVLKVLDFGLVKELGPSEGTRSLETEDGTVVGTPAYMSPEQAAGHRQIDARTDIYSLGAVAYFLISGRPPFGDRSPIETIAALLYESPPPLPADSIASSELAAIINRSLAKQPNDRFPDIISMEGALRAAVSRAERDLWTQEQAAQWWHAHRSQWPTPDAQTECARPPPGHSGRACSD